MIKIDVDDREVRAALAELARKLSDLTPAMHNIAEALESETERRFDVEGPGWPGLSPTTIRQREKSGHWPGKMLQVSGDLARSIESEAGPRHALVSVNKRYAAIHQFGGKAGKGRKVAIPARPYLPIEADGSLTEPARETIGEIITRYLAGR
ncbi:MAG: phage virion morphogenesis protein [Thauera sp.]